MRIGNVGLSEVDEVGGALLSDLLIAQGKEHVGYYVELMGEQARRRGHRRREGGSEGLIIGVDDIDVRFPEVQQRFRRIEK